MKVAPIVRLGVTAFVPSSRSTIPSHRSLLVSDSGIHPIMMLESTSKLLGCDKNGRPRAIFLYDGTSSRWSHSVVDFQRPTLRLFALMRRSMRNVKVLGRIRA